jgi:hypothetical protein
MIPIILLALLLLNNLICNYNSTGYIYLRIDKK